MQIPADASASSRGLRDWWTLRGRAFLGTLAITSLAVVGSGWLKGPRTVMHGALLSLATLALLPYVLAIGVIFALSAVLLFGAGFPLAHPYGIADGVAKGGAWFAAHYYGLVARQRHPLFWGVPAGVLFGGLMLWALIAVIVVPGEARTVRIFGQTRATLDRTYRDTGEFPRPDAQGHLSAAVSDGHAAPGLVVDGFGRPVRYQLTGRWKVASWVLVSSGFDGQPGADDLCLSGGTQLGVWAGRASELARLLWLNDPRTASLRDELLGIRALSCPAW